MPRDSLNIVLAVLGVLLLTVGGSVLAERLRAPKLARAAPVSVGAGERRVTLVVGGLTCAGCATRVADELRTTPGVVACSVDPPSGRAVVVCSEGVRDTSLVSAVTRAGAGFTATILAR